ncbi:MAG: hypothetical protein ACE5KT_07265 [Methanosarcinales archaeon]
MKTIFLDKNPIFDYVHKKIFNETVRRHSIQLVELIKNGELRANILEGTIFSVYNHLNYKLQRPVLKGGKNYESEKAEKEAREFVRDLFKSESWIIVSLNKKNIFKALQDENYDYEDAIQYYGFKKSGCDIFITWNIKHFKEGMTPKRFLMRYWREK